jgi:primosomal protein N' (replication factor Y)
MTDPQEQLTLPGIARAKARQATAPKERKTTVLTAVDPIARVLVDLPLAHLDRPFDYSVPEQMAATAVAGARVKVRFAGQDVDGFVLERAATSAHAGRIQPLRRVVSAEPVLSTAIADLVAEVAARYAGTRSDVLRLAVPSRHATTEKTASTAASAITARADNGPWEAYPGGAGLLDALGAGGNPRVVWAAGPGDDWAVLVAEAVVATASSGRGALVCLPDRRDVDRLDAAVKARLAADQYVVLTADAGPARANMSSSAIREPVLRDCRTPCSR